MNTVHVPPSMILVFISTLFLISRVYPWFIAVVDYALPVELVEFHVYSSIAIILALKTIYLTRKKKDSNRMDKIWRWIHSMDVLKS